MSSAAALSLLVLRTCVGVVFGTMAVAWVTNHRRNGFFIFRQGEGYEYVMTLTFAAIALAGLGAGTWSVDHAAGWSGILTAVVAGWGGAAALLAVFWRPAR